MIRRTALALCSLVMACGDDGGAADPDGSVPTDGSGSDASTDGSVDMGPANAITIPFAARVDGAAFACGTTYPNIGSTDASIQGIDFRFYVHDVKVVTANGDVPVTLDVNSYQTASGIALLDFETGGAGCPGGTTGTHTALTGTIPEGTTYTGVKFTMGVPFARNHINAALATSPMNIPSLFWTWSTGYIFLKFDLVSNAMGFSMHIGSTGCNATGSAPPTEPCAFPNVVPVTFASYVPGTSTIIADIAPVLADVDVTTNTTDTAKGCMGDPGDPECETTVPKLGLPYGEIPAEPQALFTLE